jgi:hypothetical protein
VTSVGTSLGHSVYPGHNEQWTVLEGHDAISIL